MSDKIDYDLLTLLRLEEWNLRKLVQKNPLLTVGEYYNALTKFIDNTMVVSTILEKISMLNARESDLKILADIKSLYSDMGCYPQVQQIDDIVSASKRGHTEFAAEYAQKMLKDHNYLYAKVKVAKEKGGIENTFSDEDEIKMPKETQVLKKVIQLMEYSDANRKLRILVVDDAPSILKMISSVLSPEYKVDTLIDPTMVNKFLQQIMPDLFLLDYQMPELNGFDLVPIIRSFEDHKDTPIIFLTSQGTMDHVSKAYSLGACDYIVKPFQDNVLKEKIKKHIVRKKLL